MTEKTKVKAGNNESTDATIPADAKTLKIKVYELELEFIKFTIEDFTPPQLELLLSLEIGAERLKIGKTLFTYGFIRSSNTEELKKTIGEKKLEKYFVFVFQQLALYWFDQISIPVKKNTIVSGL